MFHKLHKKSKLKGHQYNFSTLDVYTKLNEAEFTPYENIYFDTLENIKLPVQILICIFFIIL